MVRNTRIIGGDSGIRHRVFVCADTLPYLCRSHNARVKMLLKPDDLRHNRRLDGTWSGQVIHGDHDVVTS